MELFLNLLCLAIAAIAFGSYLGNPPVNPRRSGLWALVCALALLVPAISVTDDLQMDISTPEYPNSVQKFVNSAAPATGSEAIISCAIALDFFAALTAQRLIKRLSCDSLPAAHFARRIVPRAPPHC
jgi:hypothetical protein